MKGSYGRYALAGALLCALLAAWLNLRFLEMQEEKVEVATLTREVQPFTAIPEDAVRLTAMPVDAVPADAITDPAALAGRYTRALLIPGTLLRQAHLVEAGGSNLAARLAAEQAPDARAMALQVNEATGVAGTLREGDPVDVLVAISADTAGAEAQGKVPEGTLSRVIAQRVPVLYVQRSDTGGPATVVLQVTPKTAEEIAFAQANGMIWLLTSPYQAAESVATTGVDRQIFFERYGIDEDAAGGSLQPAGAQTTGAQQAGTQPAGAQPVAPKNQGAPVTGQVGARVGGN